MKYTAYNNYVATENGETVYIADTDRDARKIAELMSMLPGEYDPPTEDEQRRSSIQKRSKAKMSQYTAEGYDKLHRETLRLWNIMLNTNKGKPVTEWMSTPEWKKYICALNVELVYYDAWTNKS